MVRNKREGEIVPRDEIARPVSVFGELENLFSDLDSWFWGPSLAFTPRMASEGFRTPRINVQDMEDKYIVTAEMPGVKKENLEINIHDNVLELSAQENVEVNEENEETGYIYREMRRSSFHRQIPFDREILPEQCDAELKDGILTVNPKKAAEEKPKKHSISVK